MEIRDSLLLKDPIVIDFLQFLAKETKLQNSALVEIDLNKIKSILPYNANNYLSYFDKNKIALLKKILVSHPSEPAFFSETNCEFIQRITDDTCFTIETKDFFEKQAKAFKYNMGILYFECNINKIEQILTNIFDNQKFDSVQESNNNNTKIDKSYKISVLDRTIKINNYIISKPYSTGPNFEFFEYIRNAKPGSTIKKDQLPDACGDLSLKKLIGDKSFIKILNELGFKGEISKAFFPKRGKDILIYFGDKITYEKLKKQGIKMKLFIKELELADAKNS